MVNLIPIPSSVKETWARCNLEGSILLSLSIQGFLILAAPLRKRTARPLEIFLIWAAYLLADFIALFTLGLISNKQEAINGPLSHSSKTTSSSSTTALTTSGDINGDLAALWAPFCLLHLGGPDTITAFSLQDNALWVRHLVGLIIQVFVVVYTFIQSLPANKLWLPISFILAAGIIKYAERTRALYLANLDSFRGYPGPNYAKLMQEYSARRQAGIPARIHMVLQRRDGKSVLEKRPSTSQDSTLYDDVTVVQHAHHFFLTFMNLIVDQLVLLISDRNESRHYFHEISAEQAMKVLSVELNFFYEVLYTKAVVVHRKLGYFWRCVSSISIFVALSLFFVAEKQRFRSTDVRITYTLFGGAIVLDVLAFFMFVFSDWTVVLLDEKTPPSLKNIFEKYLKLKSSELSNTETNDLLERARKAVFGRWSETLSLYNFMEYCLKELPNKNVPKIIRCCHTSYIKVIDFFGLMEFRERRKYVSRIQVTADLWKFIFKELQSESMLTDDTGVSKIMSLKKGDWILRYVKVPFSELINNYITEVDYDGSLLLWHIATELCYNVDKLCDQTNNRLRETSKTLSEYMLNLIRVQPTLMSSVAGIAKMRFGDTLAEAHRFFAGRIEGGSLDFEDACTRLLKVDTEDYKPATVKGKKSKSVLFDACVLAKELRNMEEKNRWEFVSKIWVGLLSYAACRCRPSPHLDLLGKGGELITYVWLLMAHFGVGKQLYVTEDHATAKLIVDM
ncbi:hypothetical protein L484_003352 [Morus notabilis]|uniref:DUF4220 domain-containing protein n=2 Tax=Morus notabilis TaxID=981085 RepID=W9R7Y5_9ROSA|nr:hypothetical protein L484_003352 [Morus notabilis]